MPEGENPEQILAGLRQVDRTRHILHRLLAGLDHERGQAVAESNLGRASDPSVPGVDTALVLGAATELGTARWWLRVIKEVAGGEEPHQWPPGFLDALVGPRAPRDVSPDDDAWGCLPRPRRPLPKDALSTAMAKLEEAVTRNP